MAEWLLNSPATGAIIGMVVVIVIIEKLMQLAKVLGFSKNGNGHERRESMDVFYDILTAQTQVLQKQTDILANIERGVNKNLDQLGSINVNLGLAMERQHSSIQDIRDIKGRLK